MRVRVPCGFRRERRSDIDRSIIRRRFFRIRSDDQPPPTTTTTTAAAAIISRGCQNVDRLGSWIRTFIPERLRNVVAPPETAYIRCYNTRIRPPRFGSDARNVSVRPNVEIYTLPRLADKPVIGFSEWQIDYVRPNVHFNIGNGHFEFMSARNHGGSQPRRFLHRQNWTFPQAPPRDELTRY